MDEVRLYLDNRQENFVGEISGEQAALLGIPEGATTGTTSTGLIWTRGFDGLSVNLAIPLTKASLLLEKFGQKSDVGMSAIKVVGYIKFC